MVKARYVGVCRGCGANTQPRNGKGDAYRVNGSSVAGARAAPGYSQVPY
jgi:hypothetical protein